MKGFVKHIIVALLFVLGTAVIMIIFGLLTRRSVNFDLIFNACFFVGVLITGIALVIIFMPARLLLSDKLTDHSNIADRYRELRERKREKANEFLFLGITIIMISGLIQLIFWYFTH
jgi:hypothetical protein